MNEELKATKVMDEQVSKGAVNATTGFAVLGAVTMAGAIVYGVTKLVKRFQKKEAPVDTVDSEEVAENTED